jgi:hypothetical protein
MSCHCILKCTTSLCVWLAGLLFCLLSQAQDVPIGHVKIQIEPPRVIGHISPDFIGLGYETSAVAQTNYFGANNITLIQLYRNLRPHGLIRIGGNVSDHTRYVADGVSAVRSEKEVTIINQTNLERLAAFARATGWKVMWGLNLGTGSKEAAAAEAKAVAAALGDHLQSFQIGNEVDFHSGYNWNVNNYDSYYSNYLAYKAAIRNVLPQAQFSGPDVAVNMSWLTAFAKSEANDVKLLTHHYYRADASSREATIEYLLKPDTRWKRTLEQLQYISQECGVPYRINEVNSFSGGGKVGVSDTFAGALWCLDFMFLAASHGCEGVNLETDINQHAWISHYSPIVHAADGRCSACPEYYGMLAFSMAGNGDLLKLDLNKDDINLTAYATRDSRGDIWLTVINKDLTKSAQVEAALPEGFSTANAFCLQAPSVKSKTQISFAGGKFSPNGRWIPGKPEKPKIKKSNIQFSMPPVSAFLLRLK